MEDLGQHLVVPLLPLSKVFLFFDEGADELGDLSERAAAGREVCPLFYLGFAEGCLCMGDVVEGCSDVCGVAVGHSCQDSGAGGLCPEVSDVVTKG
ncbi:MAG: hypothetical protein QG597_74 [Actinomycetota bacterium]|nr:hypothetical protein [Actinomycetota bacterium]